LFSTGPYGDRVIIIDGATDRVITAIPVGKYPYNLALNPVENRVYVGHVDTSETTVAVIRDVIG
jgi:YVTN family beta-propeller protein